MMIPADARICVLGLGYVGLPLAVAFGAVLAGARSPRRAPSEPVTETPATVESVVPRAYSAACAR